MNFYDFRINLCITCKDDCRLAGIEPAMSVGCRDRRLLRETFACPNGHFRAEEPERVSPEIIEERQAICDHCDRRKVNGSYVYCIAGCDCHKVTIASFIGFVENIPKRGCLHPKRNCGKGWKQ